MQQDFLSALLYFLFDEDIKAHPMPASMQAKFLETIHALVYHRGSSNQTQNKGE